MDVLELIETNTKSKNFTSLYKIIIATPEDLAQLIEIATSNLKHPFPEYASWLIVHISKDNPAILKNYQEKIIDRILISSNQSVLRNLVYSNNLIGRSKHKEGELLDFFLEAIKNEENKVALQVYSLYALIDFVKDYPELKTEINEILQLKPEPLKPALKVAIRNFYKATKDL